VLLPSLRNIIEGFHLNSSNPDFNCTAFDKLSDQSSWSSSFYSCGAYLPGSTKDLAKHYNAPNNEFKLSSPVKAIIVTLSIIAGLFLCALLMRLYVNKTKKRRGSLTRSGSATVAGIGVEGGNIDLEEVRVTRLAEEEEDALPKYQRVGKPGEVPPGYTLSENLGADQVDAGNVNTETLNTARVQARRGWIFWR